MKKRSLNIVLTLGIVLGLFVGALGTASGQDNGVGPIGDANTSYAFFPWVANGSDTDGAGPNYGSITLQNLHGAVNAVDIYVSDEDDGWAHSERIVLQANGSITLTAEELGVPSPGGAVYAQGWASDGTVADTLCVVTANFLGSPDALPQAMVDAGIADDLEEAEALLEDDEFLGTLVDVWDLLTAVGLGTTDVEVFAGLTGDECAAIGTVPGVYSWSVTADGGDGVDLPAEYGQIAGVYKQAQSDGQLTAGQTGGADSFVDGYSGLTLDQVSTGSDEYVLPIVQTNNEWNTIIRIANLGSGTGLTPYTITIYEEGSSGALGASVGQFTGNFRPGQIATHDLLDLVDEGFVGTAFIETNVPTGAIAERVKTETDMLLMTPSRPVLQEQGTTVAPLIFQDFNFWNTGISAANTDLLNNTTVNFNYFPPLSGVNQDQRNIAPRAMEFVYRPGDQETGIGTLGAAILNSAESNAAFVDQVKYFGTEEGGVGNALGYPTVPLADHAVEGESLGLPLFQKGAAENGDTSGIQLFNTSASDDVTFEVRIYNTAGNLVAPTLLQPIEVTLAARDNFTLYAHNYQELPTGFQGSVIITVTDGDGLLTGVSNNVNYGLDGDGSVGFNLVNVPAPPEPPVEPDPVFELLVDPAEADNVFTTGIVEGPTVLDAVWDAIDGLNLGFNPDVLLDGFVDTDNGEVDVEGAVEAGIEDGLITAEEGDLILFVAGNIGNFHTVQAWVNVDGVLYEDLDEDDLDIEIQVLNEFGVQVAEVTEFDLDVEDGVASITYGVSDAYYTGEEPVAAGGSDNIIITATIGDDDDAVVLEGSATKTWVQIELPNGVTPQ